MVLNRCQSYIYYKSVTNSYMVFWWTFTADYDSRITNYTAFVWTQKPLNQIKKKKNLDAYWFESNAYFRSLEHRYSARKASRIVKKCTEKPRIHSKIVGYAICNCVDQMMQFLSRYSMKNMLTFWKNLEFE